MGRKKFAQRLFSLITKGVSGLSTIGGYFAAILTFLMSLLVATDVTLRTTLNAPFPMTLEIAMYLMVAIAFLGLAYALKEKGHIKVEILIQFFPQRVKRVVNICTYLITLACVALLLKLATERLLHLYFEDVRVMTFVVIHSWTLYILIPIGLFLFLLQLMVDFSSLLLAKGER